MKTFIRKLVRLPSLLAAVLLALIYGVIFLASGSLPGTDSLLQIGERTHIALPFQFSRWWDILFVLVYASVVLEVIERTKGYNKAIIKDECIEFDIRLSCILGLGVGFALVLVNTILALGVVIVFIPITFSLMRDHIACDAKDISTIQLDHEKTFPFLSIAIGSTVGILLSWTYRGVVAFGLGLLTGLLSYCSWWIGLKLAPYFPKKEKRNLVKKEVS